MSSFFPSSFSGFKTLHFKNDSGDTIFLNESDGGVIGQILTSDSVGAVTLGARSNHDLRLSTNDSERMRINSSGNVGIGAATVDRKLHVENAGDVFMKLENTTDGTAQIEFTTTDGNSYVGPTAGTFDIFSFPAKDMVFGVSGVERMRITSGGCIGLGVTQPETATRVHILGDPILQN